MYELALFEWHLTPSYIDAEWTDELLTLMFRARARRFKRANQAMEDAQNGTTRGRMKRHQSEDSFFESIGYKPNVVN